MFKYFMFFASLAVTILFIFLLWMPFTVYAGYDRHDGSQYSCNEINSERAYAKKTDRQEFKRLDKEYRKYCK
jgi:hypothetical protein